MLSQEQTVQLLVSPNAAAAQVESEQTEEEADRLKQKEKELAKKREEEQERMLQELEALELEKQVWAIYTSTLPPWKKLLKNHHEKVFISSQKGAGTKRSISAINEQFIDFYLFWKYFQDQYG